MNFLSVNLLLLLLQLATFCKSETRDERRKDSFATKSGAAPPASTGSQSPSKQVPVAEPGKGPGEEEVSSTEVATSTDCDAAPQINVSDFADVDEALETKVKVYGETASAMVVIDLPKYQHGLLDGLVLLLQPSKRVVAQRGVDPLVDIREDTTIRPLVFDNINLKADKQIAILFRLNCTKCSSEFEYKKFMMREAITFSNTFNGKPVTSLTPSSAPADFYKSQALPIVGPDPKSTKFDVGDIYTTASKGATYTVENLDDVYITDLMGNIIAIPGAPLKDFINYPEFIVYRPVGTAYFIRTFVRLF